MHNLLQQSPQMLLQGGGQPPMPPQQPTQQQISDAHSHFSYMQKMLNNLIKMPDSELDLRAVIEAAADGIDQYQISGGKRGVSAQMVAAEMSSPSFPTIDSSAQEIRQFLQNYFDQSVMTQAHVTHKFGGPQQEMPEQ